MKGELYEYNNKMMTQAEISKLEGINRSTLADWYKKTGNMYKAVEEAKRSQAQRNISYYDEILSLKAISKKEQIKFESLKRNYETLKDIYKAVEKTKQDQSKRNGDILYNGEYKTIYAIANLEGVGNKSLAKYYNETNDIYEAVRLAKKAQDSHNGTILYNGQMMSISKIASLEGLKKETLKKYYELYGNIEKAIFITKESQLKRKQAILRGKKSDYSELSKCFGISIIKLDRLLSSGKTAEEVENEINIREKNKVLTINEESLYQYCLDNSYNYWVIRYMINTYGKTVEEAVNSYVNNGQQVPTKWIYEKFHILFKHLMLKFGMDSNRIIKVIKEEHCNIEDAITKIIFISNNQDNDFSQIEIEWMEDLYSFLIDCNDQEKEEAINTFYITERELSFLNKKSIKIELIKRQTLLFEISSIIDDCGVNDLIELFKIYNISNEEIKIIFSELYKPFDENIINPNPEFLKHKEIINNILFDYNITIEDIKNSTIINEDEKSSIIFKREKIELILESRKENYKKIC